MRRPPLLLAAFRNVLLLLALASAVGLGAWQSASCAMHGLGAAVAGTTGVGHADPAMASTHEGGHHRHDEGAPRCDCSCIGDCTLATPLLTPPTSVTLRIALVHAESRLPLDREPLQAPPVEPDRLLPFANGPPASALS